MFKVNNKDITTTIVNFEHINAGWGRQEFTDFKSPNFTENYFHNEIDHQNFQ